jgi:hypothetical protein
MREAGAGTLLYTTGAGSVDPVPQIGNVNTAAAALRNWVINLHKELAGTGIQAAHVAIDVSVNTPAFPGAPTAPAEQIATVYWELHAANRDDAERIFTTETPWAAVGPTHPSLIPARRGCAAYPRSRSAPRPCPHLGRVISDSHPCSPAPTSFSASFPASFPHRQTGVLPWTG